MAAKPAPELALALLFAGAMAGCTSFIAGPPLDQCIAGLLPVGHEVRVRVVWNATGEPVDGACVNAYPETEPAASSQVRTNAEGLAVLRLPERGWNLYALKAAASDGLCAWTTSSEEAPRGPLRVTGPAEVTLRLRTDAKTCA